MSIAIVSSSFNQAVTLPLLEGCLSRLEALGIDLDQTPITRVPGAIELPIAAQQYARLTSYRVIICLGAVIRGNTNHYYYVCQQASQGCQQVALTYNTPVIFGVLTVETLEQALERVSIEKSHKGFEAANAAVDMLKVMQRFQELGPTKRIKS